MRVNVYTEEMLSAADGTNIAEIVTAEYISSRTGEKMTNYGLRIFMKSAPELHYIPGRDDDRSAVTFWCGSKPSNLRKFLESVAECVHMGTLEVWRGLVDEAAIKAEANR